MFPGGFRFGLSPSNIAACTTSNHAVSAMISTLQYATASAERNLNKSNHHHRLFENRHIFPHLKLRGESENEKALKILDSKICH